MNQNEQPTTQNDSNEFIRTNTIAFDVEMADAENNGLPTMRVNVVPKGTNDLATMKATRRILLEIFFSAGGENDKAHIVFYNPDGTEFMRRGSIEDLAEDDSIMPPLNGAWTGDENSTFMQVVHLAVAHAVKVMQTAHMIAGMTGGDEQQLFSTMLQRTIPGGTTVIKNDPEEVQS